MCGDEGPIMFSFGKKYNNIKKKELCHTEDGLVSLIVVQLADIATHKFLRKKLLNTVTWSKSSNKVRNPPLLAVQAAVDLFLNHSMVY